MLHVKIIITITTLALPIGCSRNNIVPTADPSAALLTGISENTAKHYAGQIRNFGTEKCRYRDKENQEFWEGVRGDLQVVSVWSASENPRANENILIPLQVAYRDAEKMEELIDTGNASRTADGAPLYCIEPEVAVLQTKNLVPAVGRMIQAIKND